MTATFRLLGIFPLFFFLAHLFHSWNQGTLGNMLWICYIGNLLLALGMFLKLSVCIRVAVSWLIPGLVLWVWFVVLKGEWIFTAFLTHIGGLIIGLIAFSKVRADNKTWIYSIAFFLFIQLISRIITPATLDVNIAHNIYKGWDIIFSKYWQFWLAMTFSVVVLQWFIGIVLLKLWPPYEAKKGL